jgi:hypothetical protein
VGGSGVEADTALKDFVNSPATECMLAVAYFFFAIPLSDPGPAYEQLATEYFFETIWKERYSDYKSVEFANRTETRVWDIVVRNCIEWSAEDRKAIENGNLKEQVPINVNPGNVSIKKRKTRSTRLKLFIATKIQLADVYIVQIDVYKPMNFVDHFFIKIDKEGKIIDKCETYEVI